MPPVIVGGSQYAYLRELIVRRVRSCCDLFLRDQHLAADITLSEVGETVLDTASQSLVGAINELLAAIVLEDLWDRAGTLVYPHNAGDSVRSDSLLYTIGGGLPAAAVNNALSMGHDPATHASWIASRDVGNNDLDIYAAPLNFRGFTVFYASGQVNTNGYLYFGGANQTGISYRAGQTPDSVVWELPTSSYCITFIEKGDSTTDFQASYTTPTIRIQNADHTDITKYVAKQHDGTDAKDIIGAGSEVVEHKNPVELANNGSFDLPDATSGFGYFQAGDGEEYAQVSWDSAGVVTGIVLSANAKTTDTGAGSGDFCIFDNGTQVRVTNRMGAAKKVIFRYKYWTP